MKCEITSALATYDGGSPTVKEGLTVALMPSEFGNDILASVRSIGH